MEYTDNAYDAAVTALFARHQSVQSSGFTAGSYKPGLDSMRGFDAVLGFPSRALRCIHVAGTNGKGSVCSIIASSLASMGYRVGLYTSPHLLDFRERIKIVSPVPACEMIPKAAVFDFLNRFESALDGLSFFEITTGMAFYWFASRQPDYVVVETGLGGRLDSTNIITPLISIITSIGLDHCDILGPTRSCIAREKAGIFKAGVPALVASDDSETAGVFRSCASDAGAPLTFADSVSLALDESSLLCAMDLGGPCQKQNLHTSLVALHILGLMGDGVADGVKTAGRSTGLRGRWEVLCESPSVIADIGHNPPALKINFERLEKLGASGQRRLALVYGIMKDKDLDAISAFFPSGAVLFLCAPKNQRALPLSDLAARVAILRPELASLAYESVADAVRAAMEYADGDGIVYIGGSTFVVAEALSCPGLG